MHSVIEGSLGLPSMTEPIIMGLKVGPWITDTSQSNRGTRGHHNPYPMIRIPRRNLRRQKECLRYDEFHRL